MQNPTGVVEEPKEVRMVCWDLRNTGLEETQAAIKIAGRNINNLRYTDNTILMGENKEKLKSFLKEENE